MMMAAPFILTLAFAAAPQTVTPVSPAPAAPSPVGGAGATRVDPAQPTVRKSTGPVRRVGGDAEAGPLRDELETVDAGAEDVGPLGTSFRQTSYDPRLPAGFTRVYRVPGDERKFMRGNGALFAIFPASVYRRTSRGGMPVTPPGTVYRIGMPGDLHLAPEAHAARELAPLQRDTRIDGRLDARIEPTQVADAAPVQTRIDARVDARAQQTTAANAANAATAGRTAPQRAPAAESPDERTADALETPVESHGVAADPYAHLAFGAPRVERD